MRHKLFLALLVLLPLGFLCADDTKQFQPLGNYPYGFTGCLKGSGESGIILRLRQNPRCESRTSYPYLEFHIAETPVPVDRQLVIGNVNSAFRCLGAKSACEWFSSGAIKFDHFESVSKKGIRTDGWYEVKSNAGMTETGFFIANCVSPCG